MKKRTVTLAIFQGCSIDRGTTIMLFRFIVCSCLALGALCSEFFSKPEFPSKFVVLDTGYPDYNFSFLNGTLRFFAHLLKGELKDHTYPQKADQTWLTLHSALSMISNGSSIPKSDMIKLFNELNTASCPS